jgi:hypothetical protein
MKQLLQNSLAYFFERKRLEGFEELLQENGCKSKLNGWVKSTALLGFAAALFAIAAGAMMKADNIYITLFAFAAFTLPFILGYFFQLFVFEQRKLQKEELVPDLLLQASVFPRNTNALKIIDYLARQDFGLLGKDFKRAAAEIKRGASVEKALLGIRKRCKSRIVSRAVGLLVQSYRSGADMGTAFREAAEDILETQAVLRERVATMVVEKYTLLLAGGLIVPAVLGLIVGLVQGMGFEAIGALGLGMPIAERRQVLAAALFANQIYLAEYALLASLFIANQEGNLKKAVVYAIVLLPLGYTVYFLAKGF